MILKKVFRLFFSPKCIIVRNSSSGKFYRNKQNFGESKLDTTREEWRHEFDRERAGLQQFVSSDMLKIAGKRNRERTQTDLQCNGEILFGLHPVYLALKQQRRAFYRLYMKKKGNSPGTGLYEKLELRENILQLADDLQIEKTYVNSRILDSLCGGRVHQGVCLDASLYPLLDFQQESPIENCEDSEKPLWLVLNEIQDPMNVGAILRSACYFGVHKIFVISSNCCRLSPVVSKASSGALELSEIFQIDDLVRFLQDRRQDNWCVVSTAPYESLDKEPGTTCDVLSLIEFKLSKPTILIFGNESKGVSSEIKSCCDHLLCITSNQSQCSDIDSLNVSVASGIILHHLLCGNYCRLATKD